MSAPRLICPHCSGELRFRSMPLTRRQAEILIYLDDQIRTHGHAPSFDEIAKWFGFASLATVHEHLTNLERKGAIRRRFNEARSVVVLVSPDDLAELALEAA